MLEAPALPLLLAMASPNALAFIVQACVNMTEVWYVGQLGTIALAGMALVYPMLMLMQMLANGALGGAVTGAIARALGSGERDKAERLIWHAIMIALAAGFGFLALMLLFVDPILAVMSDDALVVAESKRYLTILFSGCPFLWTMALLMSAYRGMGNMRFPAFLMVAGAFIQVPLSGALVLGWFGVESQGLSGAAVSILTVAALSTLALVLGLLTKTSLLQLKISQLVPKRALFHDILRVGLPSALSPIFTIGTISGLNILVSSFGVAALAGYGVASRIEFLVIPLVFGLGVAMNALVGTNLGAGQVKRAVHIGWVGSATAALLAGTGGLLLALFPEVWAGMFTDDPATLESACAYLVFAGPFFAFQGLGLSLYFASQGAGAMTWPLIANFARMLITIGGGALLLYSFDASLTTLYLISGLGMFAVGVTTATALKLGMWERVNPAIGAHAS